MMKMCEYCSMNEVPNARAKYCSTACRVKANRGQKLEEAKSNVREQIADMPTPRRTVEDMKEAELKRQMEAGRKALDEIMKKRGLPSMDERDELAKDKGFLSTGFVELDMLIANGEIYDDGRLKGGFPLERVSEIFGRKGIGKSTIMSRVARANEVPTLYFDTEGAFNPDSVPEYVQIVRENILENIWGMVNDALESKKYTLIVVDSLAGSTTLAEQMQDNEVAGFSTSKSKILNQWMRGLTHRLIGSGTALVFTNQIRDSLSSFGASEYIPGGNAIPFYASLRIALHSNAADRITVNGMKTGHRITAKLDKSRYGPDQATTKFTLKFGKQ